MSVGICSMELRDLSTSRALADWIADMAQDPHGAARVFDELVDRVEARCARLGVPYRSRGEAEATARSVLEMAILSGSVRAAGNDLYVFGGTQ